MQDIDIHPYSDAERIKVAIVNADHRYYPVILQISQRNAQDPNVPSSRLARLRRCAKVDIHTSGTISLPAILASDTPRINNIRVMPLFDLLVMKTRAGGTTAFRRARDFQAMVKADIVDIDVLLIVRRRRGLSMMTSVRCAYIRVSLWSGRSCWRVGCAEALPVGQMEGLWIFAVRITASSCRLPCSAPVSKIEINSHCTVLRFCNCLRSVHDAIVRSPPGTSWTLVVLRIVSSFLR